MKVKVGLGQDSHAFDTENSQKKLVLAGVVFEGYPGLKGNSDADVVLHALTNSISSITGNNIIGKIADEMCNKGVTDSKQYLNRALQDLDGYTISHISISIEAKTPKISPKIAQMKLALADLFTMDANDIGITATTGEGLTTFGRGEGIQALSIITAISE